MCEGTRSPSQAQMTSYRFQPSQALVAQSTQGVQYRGSCQFVHNRLWAGETESTLDAFALAATPKMTAVLVQLVGPRYQEKGCLEFA